MNEIQLWETVFARLQKHGHHGAERVRVDLPRMVNGDNLRVLWDGCQLEVTLNTDRPGALRTRPSRIREAVMRALPQIEKAVVLAVEAERVRAEGEKLVAAQTVQGLREWLGVKS